MRLRAVSSLPPSSTLAQEPRLNLCHRFMIALRVGEEVTVRFHGHHYGGVSHDRLYALWRHTLLDENRLGSVT